MLIWLNIFVSSRKVFAFSSHLKKPCQLTSLSSCFCRRNCSVIQLHTSSGCTSLCQRRCRSFWKSPIPLSPHLKRITFGALLTHKVCISPSLNALQDCTHRPRRRIVGSRTRGVCARRSQCGAPQSPRPRSVAPSSTASGTSEASNTATTQCGAESNT